VSTATNSTSLNSASAVLLLQDSSRLSDGSSDDLVLGLWLFNLLDLFNNLENFLDSFLCFLLGDFNLDF
jgi:hypothetical protein